MRCTLCLCCEQQHLLQAALSVLCSLEVYTQMWPSVTRQHQHASLYEGLQRHTSCGVTQLCALQQPTNIMAIEPAHTQHISTHTRGASWHFCSRSYALLHEHVIASTVLATSSLCMVGTIPVELVSFQYHRLCRCSQWRPAHCT